ncbi:dynein light intermediate chain 2, cytosolic, putative [Plasmodium gallinaceum]|uniref:Dynein light intermediate chain n=1 Tax=Plasmodium gallinaceum TaxID=5849 RepID=A0A1J1GVN0_PLAGA|nr:dynein light intermediate chain 2, cytosolic, putative [Plasmodium gallinaceum]CRG96610.1 dynein light intermediate chain 2, cytosolic, putative [Plasmodium gallinaceum]
MKRENNNLSKSTINILKKNSTIEKHVNLKTTSKIPVSNKEKIQIKKKESTPLSEKNIIIIKKNNSNYSEKINTYDEEKSNEKMFKLKKKSEEIDINGNSEEMNNENNNNDNNEIVNDYNNDKDIYNEVKIKKIKEINKNKEDVKEKIVSDNDKLNEKIESYEKIYKMENLVENYKNKNENECEKKENENNEEIKSENERKDKDEEDEEDENEEKNENEKKDEDENNEEIKSESEKKDKDEEDEEDENEEKNENEKKDKDEDKNEYEEKNEKEKKKKQKDKSYEKGSIYQSILKKLSLEKNEELENSHIIIFGNKDVGKSSLIQSLQRISMNGDINNEELYQIKSRVLPLDYACLNIRNLEENNKVKDIKGYSHIWVLQHSSYISSLIKHMKKCKNIKKIVILICTDLFKPYNIISDLNNWIECLYILFEELHSYYDLEVFNELKEKLENYIYNYKKHMFEKKNKNKNDTYDLDKKSLIKINLAFPIFFIICKSDGYEILNNRTYQGYIDVIISYLRNLAINYQASIIFCNTINKKEPKNIDILYKYIMHRIYNFSFNENAILDDYEKIFIPSGYDDQELINESIKNTFVENFSKPYDSIIIKPISNKSIVEHSQNIVQDIYFNDFLESLTYDITTNEIDDKKEDDDEKIKNSVIFNENNKSKEEVNQKSLNKEKNDQSLHSFFQSLLAKGRSKSPSAPNISPLPLEKKF